MNPQKLINLISEFGKVTGYKINIQKCFYFYILATNNKKWNEENNSIHNCVKKEYGHLGINSTKEGQVFYIVN